MSTKRLLLSCRLRCRSCFGTVPPNITWTRCTPACCSRSAMPAFRMPGYRYRAAPASCCSIRTTGRRRRCPYRFRWRGWTWAMPTGTMPLAHATCSMSPSIRSLPSSPARIEPKDAQHASACGTADLARRGPGRLPGRHLPPAQAAIAAAVPSHRRLLRHDHPQPQGVRHGRLADRHRRRGRAAHRGRGHPRRGSADTCDRRHRATSQDAAPTPDHRTSGASMSLRNPDERWGAGEPGPALADRRPDRGDGLSRPDHGRPADDAAQDHGVHAAQVHRHQHPGAGRVAAGVAAVRGCAARAGRDSGVAVAHRVTHARGAVRAAVRDADQRLGVEFVDGISRCAGSTCSTFLASREERVAACDSPGRCTNLFWTLVALALVHAAAAIFHHLFQHDETLARMLPRGWLRVPSRRNTSPCLESRVLASGLLLVAAPVLAADYVQAPGSSLVFAGIYQGEVFTGRFPGFVTHLSFDPAQLATSKLDVTIPLATATTANADYDDADARRRVLRRRASSRRRTTPPRISARSAATVTPPTARCRCTASASRSR